MKGALAGLALLALGGSSVAQDSESRYQAANEAARTGDLLRAIEGYREIAAGGDESASLYWNWAQAASSRGDQGEALWALLRARELDPGDRAVRRDVEAVRESLNLDPAEIAPEPLAAAARLARRFHLDLLAAALLLLSLAAVLAATLYSYFKFATHPSPSSDRSRSTSIRTISPR